MNKHGPDTCRQECPADVVWLGVKRNRLIIEQFDDEFILYNKLSGDTHVLNQESKLIVDAISFHPSSPVDVRASILSDALASADISVVQIQQHLAILEQWGIAQRIR